MHIPNLSPDMTIPGLSKDWQARLSDLVTKVVYAPGNWDDRRKYRHECEDKHLAFIQSAAYRLESGYLHTLSAAGTMEEKREVLEAQEVFRCKFVAETLALHQMYATRKMHTQALAAELVELKKLISQLDDYHPLVALLVDLLVLVRQSGQVEPHDAFNQMHRASELPVTRPFDAVQRIFEELRSAPTRVRSDHTSGIKIPYIEIDDAEGPQFVLLEALRAAEFARQSCPDSVILQGVRFAETSTIFIARLESAVNGRDHRLFEQVKREMEDAQASFFAAGVNFKLFRNNLQAARVRLAEALVPACNAIGLDCRYTLSTPDAVAKLKAVINCIAAHRMIIEIAQDSQRDVRLLKAFNNAPLGVKKYIDSAVRQILPPPAVY